MIKKKILVLTPTLTGGSWVCVEELLSASKDNFKYQVIGLGPSRKRKIGGVRTTRIPYFMFDKLGSEYASNIFFNYIYQIPLMVASLLAVPVYRPAVVLSNGFTPVLLAMPVCKLLGVKVVVYYGSFLERVIKNKFIHALFKRLNLFVDAVFVNSEGSKNDVSRFIDVGKILVIEHWTDIKPASFEERLRLRKELGVNNKFLILYVGKLSPDKTFEYLLDAAGRLGDLGDLEIWFAGSGPLSFLVEEAASRIPAVSYLGFVKDAKKLIELYTVADITWSYADETYLSRPAIESLALGTPIMIPNTPAVMEKKGKRRLPKSLFPGSVGWLVDIANTKEIAKLIREIKDTDVAGEEMRKECVRYAKKHYSRKNIEMAVELINEL